MKHEEEPGRNESSENIEQLFLSEIKKALSPTWAKTTQELLPHYLPNKFTPELSKEELASYQTAYRILGEMIKNEEIEVVFEEERVEIPSNPARTVRGLALHSVLESETIARPKFKLKSHGGKKSKNERVAWQGSSVADLGS